MKSKIHKYLYPFLLIFTVVLITSCDVNKFYDQSTSIPESGWHKDSSAYFSIEIDDSLQVYDFYITLRNNDDYAFRNFYFFLSTKLPNNHITRDTIELILADLDGKWLGNGFGTLKDNQIPIRKNLKFPLGGTYHFQIEQAMRQDILKGITDVGVRVEYAE